MRWRLEKLDPDSVTIAELSVGKLRESGRCVIYYKTTKRTPEGATSIRRILCYDLPGTGPAPSAADGSRSPQGSQMTQEQAYARALETARMASPQLRLLVGVCIAVVVTTWLVVWLIGRRLSLCVTWRLALGVGLALAVGTPAMYATHWCEWRRYDRYVARRVVEWPVVREDARVDRVEYTFTNGSRLIRPAFDVPLEEPTGEAAFLSVIAGVGAMLLRSRRR